MLNILSKNKKSIITYSIICAILVGLSTISLAFNEWVVILNMAICSLCGIGNLILLIVSREDITQDGPKVSFALFTLLRYFLMLVGLAISALLVFLTMGEVVNQYRYLTILISAIPFFCMTIALLFDK